MQAINKMNLLSYSIRDTLSNGFRNNGNAQIYEQAKLAALPSNIYFCAS